MDLNGDGTSYDRDENGENGGQEDESNVQY